MIFLLFFGLIALVVIVLNIIDYNNVNKIEQFYKTKGCNTVNYDSGVYQGVCKEGIIFIKNGFTVDLSKPQKIILYKDIKEASTKDKIMTIKTNNETVKFRLNIEEFFNKVEK